MNCLYLENGNLELKQAPIPAPKQDEALVRVHLAGVCATDLELCKGYYPFRGIIGHEFVGEVVKAPGGTDWLGRLVVGEINVPCNECPTCFSGKQNHCPHRTVVGIVDRDGAFAEYITIPVRNLHQVPDTIDERRAVFTEPLAAACRIREQIYLEPGSRVLLVGAGRLGQLIAQTLRHLPVELLVVARHSRQAEVLRAFGVDTCDEHLVQEGWADVVVDATGSPSGFELSTEAVKPSGTIVLKSTYAGSMSINFSSLVVNELTIVGSRCGPFAPALSLLAENKVDPTRLIDKTYPLSQGMEAMEHAARQGALKILIDPREDRP